MEWIAPKRGCSTGRKAGNFSFRLSNQKGGGDTRKQACIAISEKAMKQLRWVVGDRVIIGIDKEYVHIKRVHKDGFALSSGSGRTRAESIGKMTSAVFKTGAFNFPFDEPVHVEDYVLQDDVVVFSFKQK